MSRNYYFNEIPEDGSSCFSEGKSETVFFLKRPSLIAEIVDIVCSEPGGHMIITLTSDPQVFRCAIEKIEKRADRWTYEIN